jgi:hypothetical protein
MTGGVGRGGAVIINATNCRVHERKESDDQVTSETSFTRVCLRFVEKNHPNFLVSGNFIDRGTRRRKRPKGKAQLVGPN